MIATCELCKREVPRLTRHHLIPRARHTNRRNKKLFERADVRSRIAMICPACHAQIHALLDEKELEHGYNTVEALAGHPEMKRFLDWVRDKPGDLRVPGLSRARLRRLKARGRR